MNCMHNYYSMTKSEPTVPAWVKCEHYQNCDGFAKLFARFFKK